MEESGTGFSRIRKDFTKWTDGGDNRRKIRLIEYNAKCRYLEKLTCKGPLRQVFHLSEAPSSPMTTYFPPYTLYCIRVYSILIHTGKWAGEQTREKIRGAIVHKAD